MDWLFKLLDKLIIVLFSYRAGKSSVIMEALERKLKDDEIVKQAHDYCDSVDTNRMFDEDFKLEK